MLHDYLERGALFIFRPTFGDRVLCSRDSHTVTETNKGGGAFETPYDRDTIFIAVLFGHGYE